jgi:hypothetical protein
VPAHPFPIVQGKQAQLNSTLRHKHEVFALIALVPGVNNSHFYVFFLLFQSPYGNTGGM